MAFKYLITKLAINNEKKKKNMLGRFRGGKLRKRFLSRKFWETRMKISYKLDIDLCNAFAQVWT